MTNDEAIRWCEKTGAKVSFSATVHAERKNERGELLGIESQRGVCVELLECAGMGSTFVEAVEKARDAAVAKARARLDEVS